MIPPELEAEIDDCCDQFEAVWIAGGAPSLEEFLGAATEAVRPLLLWELVALERYYRRDAQGEPLSVSQIATLYPTLAEELSREKSPQGVRDPTPRRTSVTSSNDENQLSDVRLVDPHPSHGLHVRCPHCSNPMEILADTPYDDVTCHTCGSTFNLVDREGPTEASTTLRRLGRFDLLSRLGVGGFGTVWKARDTDLDRLVAIKIPRKGQLTSTDVEQFFREARAAAQLDHPHIVSVYEVGRADDTVFIVSDLVRGVSLADYLTGQQPTFAEIAEIGSAVAEALQHAHEQGVIHRDLKPSNIMIDENGSPLILDFGLAKREVGEITMTLEGQILGTPGYMSPEQARGQSHWTDRRSDIYSLGTVLFRMATGELPFRGNARMQLHHKLTTDPPDPRRLNTSIPRDLSTICLKCIQRDPNHRYSKARDVARELQRFLNGEPIRARPLSRTVRIWRWARRKPATATACILAIALAVGGPLAAWQQRQLLRQERTLHQQEQVRFAERDVMASRQKVEVDLQAATIATLNEQLLALRGGSSGIAKTLPGWRLSLIKDLVSARQKTMAAGIGDEATTDHNSIQSGLGLGILLAQLGRNDEALEIFQATEQRIALQTKSLDAGFELADAHADCWQRMGRLHQLLGDARLARVAVEKAIALRQQLGLRDPSAVGHRVRLLESTMQKSAAQEMSASEQLHSIKGVPLVVGQIAKHWPTSPGEFYRLACQLTKSDVLLGEDH